MSRTILYLLQLSMVVLMGTSLSPDSTHAGRERFNVVITNPQDGTKSGRQAVVEGTASIPSSNYLWILARRYNFAPLWWPQGEAKINPKTHTWRGTAAFGGPQDIGWDFDIGVITVDKDGHKLLMDYWLKAMQTGVWRPIQIPDVTSPPRIVKVKKVSH